MKNRTLAIILVAFYLPACSQSLQGEFEAINRKTATWYQAGNTDSLVARYAKDFTYIPEYKPVIYDLTDIKQFYTDWFHAVAIRSYSKKIMQVENIAGRVLEIGTFEIGYSTGSGSPAQYTGKYMIMWQRDPANKWKILSEAFGSDKYLNPADMPYASVEVKDRQPLDDNRLSPKLQPELEEFDKGVVNAVLSGDGEARAAEFTPDGIYMPHFDPMQVGMEMIKPYMLKTYSPGTIASVRDTYREIFSSGGYVFLSGHFKVSLSAKSSNPNGKFEGNMSNLMKRGPDGKLLMYRQIAHN